MQLTNNENAGKHRLGFDEDKTYSNSRTLVWQWRQANRLLLSCV